MWKEAVQLLLLLASAAAGIFEGSADGQCSNGFPSPDQLTTLLAGGVVHRNTFGRQWLFLGMNFSCEGAVLRWIIGAELGNGTRYPEIQIWRLIQPPINSVDTYKIVGSVELRAIEQSPSGVLNYTVPSPMPFLPGDVVGMFEPNSADSRIQLYFQEGQGITNHFATNDEPFSRFTIGNFLQDYASPLIAVEIGPSTFQPSSSPVTTGQIFSSPTVQTIQSLSSQGPQISEPPQPAEGGSGGTSAGGLIAGIMAAIMVVIVIVTGTIVVCLALILNKRRKRSKLVYMPNAASTVNPLDNPVYVSGDSSCQHPYHEIEVAKTGLLTPRQYETPYYSSLALDRTSSTASGVYHYVQGSGIVHRRMESEGGSCVYTDTVHSKVNSPANDSGM